MSEHGEAVMEVQAAGSVERLEQLQAMLDRNRDAYYRAIDAGRGLSRRMYGWLDEFLQRAQGETTVNMKLDYLDTSSSKHIYNIFSRLDGLAQSRPIKVNWHYESGDEEMAETGKDYESLFKLDFAFIEVEELF